jgi:hypothetical protein
MPALRALQGYELRAMVADAASGDMVPATAAGQIAVTAT